MKTIHYVYKITCNKPSDERKYYIGVKSSNNPKSDNYWGSSKYLTEAINEIGEEHFSKKILSTWETREEAAAEEIRLHKLFKVSSNLNYFNKSIATSTKFMTFGCVNVFDTLTNEMVTIEKSVYDNSERYHTVNKGKVLAKNKSTNITVWVEKSKLGMDYKSIMKDTLLVFDNIENVFKRIPVTDFDNKRYTNPSSNSVSVRNKKTGKTGRIPKDIFDNSEDYESVNKGLIQSYNIKSEKFEFIEKSFFEKSDIHVNPNAALIKIYDDLNNLVCECYGNFEDYCKDRNYPWRILKQSYQRNGEKIYLKNKPKKKEYYQFKGWFALKFDLN